jgi:hypothetical protein
MIAVTASGVCGQLDEHRHISRRIDRSIALADQVAAAADLFVLAEAAQVRHITGDRNDEGFDRRYSG